MASYKELLAQKSKLEKQIDAARAKELATVVAELKERISEYGLTADDLGLVTRRIKAKQKLPPKFMNPETGQSWSGRGRAPAWLGKNRDKFLVA